MRKLLRELKTDLDKMSLLRQQCQGKEAVVFGCGPSFNEIEKEKMLEFCKDKLVVCIKQSYFRYKEICNFHFYNDNNLVEYGHDDNIITCSSSGARYEDAKNFFWKNQRESDLHFRVVNTGFENSVAIKNNFEEIEIEKIGLNRPWGPGIMLECVFPFLIHLNLKRIYTLGWDYGHPSISGGTHLDHFYESEKRKFFLNPANVCEKYENIKLIESSKYLNDYLISKDIELVVLSETSYVSEKIKREKI